MRYADAESKLASGRKGEKKIGNNTYLRRVDGGIAVRLHATDVVTIHPDGSYTLNTGGWWTVTTKERINAYSPARLSQRRGEWYLLTPAGEVKYWDGVRVDGAGNVVG